MIDLEFTNSLIQFCYIDGGTGSMAFQMLLAGVLTAGYVVRTQWSSFVSILARVARRGRNS
jgi:hypothetical protein